MCARACALLCVYALRHESELATLRERDPEFFAFLSQSQPNLLNYTHSDDEDDSDGEDQDQGEDGDEEGGKEEDGEGDSDEEMEDNVLTMKAVRSAERMLVSSKSMRSLGTVLMMYKSGCALTSNRTADSTDENAPKYSIPDATVYEEMMVSALTHMHTAFGERIGVSGEGKSAQTIDKAEPSAVENALKKPATKRVKALALAFFRATIGSCPLHHPQALCQIRCDSPHAQSNKRCTHAVSP